VGGKALPETHALLTFGGPTALLHAYHILDRGGYECAVVPGPPEGGPCALALRVPQRLLGDVLVILRTLGAGPQRVVGPEAPADPQVARLPAAGGGSGA
jgi:hypothetical protein